MARERMFFDKTEVICIYDAGRSYARAALTKPDIINVTIEPCTAGLFRRPTERILITTRKTEKPITYYKSKEGSYFERYKAALLTFCKNNMITLYNKTGA